MSCFCCDSPRDGTFFVIAAPEKAQSVEVGYSMCGFTPFIDSTFAGKYYLRREHIVTDERSESVTASQDYPHDILTVTEEKHLVRKEVRVRDKGKLYVYPRVGPNECNQRTVEDSSTGTRTQNCHQIVMGGEKSSTYTYSAQYTGTFGSPVENVIVNDCEENGTYCWCSYGIYNSDRVNTPMPEQSDTVNYLGWEVYTNNISRPSPSSLSGVINRNLVNKIILSEEEEMPLDSDFYDFGIENLKEDINKTDPSRFLITSFGEGGKLARLRSVSYKIVHRPTLTCYLKVWIREVFTPQGGGDTIAKNLTPYEWKHDGADPCMNDPSKSVLDIVNNIESALYQIDPPSEPGVRTFNIVKYSFVEGYTPADPDINNNRPVPDLMPNGFPL